MPIANPPTVTSREEARRELLAKEKRLTKLRDEPNADRRRLPMIRRRRRRQRAPARARLRQLLLRRRRHPGASAATAPCEHDAGRGHARALRHARVIP